MGNVADTGRLWKAACEEQDAAKAPKQKVLAGIKVGKAAQAFVDALEQDPAKDDDQDEIYRDLFEAI